MQNIRIQTPLYALLLIFSIDSLFGQSNFFKAGVSVGINLAQIDGDHQSGYDHKGFSFGLRGGFAVNKRLDIISELLYLEKGAKPDDNITNFDQRRVVVHLKYAEVPLLMTYHLKKNDRGFYTWSFHTGFSYGRLLKSTAIVTHRFRVDTNVSKSLSQEYFSKQDWSFISGLSYNIGANFGIRFRQSLTINKLYINPNPERSNNGIVKREAYVAFRNYFISFQAYYDFISPKIKKSKKKLNLVPK